MAKTAFFKKNRESREEGRGKRRYVLPCYEFSGAVNKRMKRILSTRPFQLERNFANFLSYAPSRCYGAAILGFGLLSLILYYLGFYGASHQSTPIIAIAATVFAMPFLLTDKSLPAVFQENSITDYIFFEFFCMRRTSKSEKQTKSPFILFLIFGFLLALLGRFLPLWQIISVIGVVIFALLTLSSPEFSFFISFMIMPYSHYIPYSEIVLPCIVGLTFLSFLRKVLFGKRVLRIERYDIVIGLMLLFVLISGIFVKGVDSFAKSVQMIAMAMGYILASNVITNRRLAESAINSMIFSSTVPAVISIVQIIAMVIDSKSLSFTKAELNTVLVRADGMAVFLMAAVVMAFAMSGHGGRAARSFYGIGLTVNLLALLITGEVFALIALLISLASYRAIKTHRRVGFILTVLMILPYGLLLLPNRYLDALLSLSSSPLNTAAELMALWKNGLIAFGNHLILGIGMGADSFAEEMAQFGIYGYPDSSNLFIEIGLEAGLFALTCFALLLLIRARHRKGYYLYVRSSQFSVISRASGACIIAMLSFGAVNYIWSDLSVFYIFWTVFGIGSAALRNAKREHDDLVFYYDYTGAVDSSAIDVEIG